MNASDVSDTKVVSAVVLAAGESRRMPGAGSKMTLSVAEGSLIEAALKPILGAALSEIIVVTGFDHEGVCDVLGRHSGLTMCHNPDFSAGMASSIAAGVGACAEDSGGIMICLGDMPGIQPATLRDLLGKFRDAERQKDAVIIPVCRGTRGHPVIFGSAYREALLQLRGDAGARSIIEENPEWVIELNIEDAGILRDIDTEDDLMDAR
jgi:molybdenum cofactor cytidylyltransferase